jgi:hypothetical protein
LWVFFALQDPDPDLDSESGLGSTNLIECGSETLLLSSPIWENVSVFCNLTLDSWRIFMNPVFIENIMQKSDRAHAIVYMEHMKKGKEKNQ